jgi:O-antigen/teichoic acid export membrane protein
VFKQIFNRFNQSDFLKNIATLVSGTALAQVISLGTAPILYRIYSKSDYGALGFYMAVGSIIGVFSTFMLSQAIILEKEDDDALKMASLCRFLNISLSGLVLVGVLIFKFGLSSYFDAETQSIWLLLLPVSIFFAGQSEIFRLWGNRKKMYKALTFNTLFSAILVPLVSISVGWFYKSPLGLFLGLLMSQILPTVILQYNFAKESPLPLVALSKAEFWAWVEKYKDLALYSLPAEFINRLTNQFPVFMLTHFLGLGVVGSFNLSNRMLGLPVQLFSGGFGEVFKQRAAEDYNNTGTCRPIFVKTFKMLSLSLLLPFGLLIALAPTLFAFVFGEQWREAGVFSAILAAMYYFKLVVSPLTYVYFIANRMKEDFYLHILILVTILSSFVVGYWLFGTATGILACYSFGYSLMYLMYLVRSYQLCVKP